jgi:D-alanyl-D-alanine carboxypeptidase/D-alanyl-D-alanine-endopeptidase (penicillin-binding protein 4)
MKNLVVVLIFMALFGCTATKHRQSVKALHTVLRNETFQNQFTGLFILSAENRDTLFDLNGEKYFTPASNTKIFTLYTGLSLLPKTIPSLKYLTLNDTLYIQGTGDPTQLHPYFKDSTAILFLKGNQHIAWYPDNFQARKYGPGWAWDDYSDYYQVERSGFPLYGNVLTLYRNDSVVAIPSFFGDRVVDINATINRESEANVFYYASSRSDTIEIPLKTDSLLTQGLLEAALGQKVTITDRFPEGEKSILYSVASDSVYKRMMWESDNFLAEQLLVLASSTLSDTLDGAKAQTFMLRNGLADLKQPPRWVDGSGLSRYNLFTPESMVHVLYKMYQELPQDRLFGLFPAGGVSGTLKNWYVGAEAPYIYAKSGSLGNNYCLSGYLKTKSGKILIFSFMNNHFIKPSGEIKAKMQVIFETIRDHY